MLQNGLKAGKLAGKGVGRCPLLGIPGIGQNIRQAIGKPLNHGGVSVSELVQPIVVIHLAFEAEGKAQGLLLVLLAQGPHQRAKSVKQVHLGEGDINGQAGADLLHQFPQARAQQDGPVPPLAGVCHAETGQIYGQHHTIQGALRAISLKPDDEMMPKTLLDLRARALTLTLAQQFTIRIDKHAFIADPPVKTEGIAIHPIVAGYVGERVGLPGPLNQAGLASILKAHHQIPGQPVNAFAAGEVAFQGRQLTIQQALLLALHGQNRIFLFLLRFGLPDVHLAQAARQHHAPHHRDHKDNAQGYQGPHLPGR